MGEPRTDLGFTSFDDDYQVVRLHLGWGAVSIVAFAAVLALQMFGRWFGVSLPQMIGGTAVLTLAGLVLGLIGLRFGRGRGAARVGVFLNGAVAGIFILVPIVSGILRMFG